MKQLLLAVVFAASLATVGSTTAQVYSSRPITMIVPFPAGGSVDAVGRIVAEGIRVSLGQTVVVENVAGAAGGIGVGRVARAAADAQHGPVGNARGERRNLRSSL
jgi:tripartite-type tricarboxylate transporter receptor subunit TctC